MTSEWQEARYVRRYGRKFVRKPAILLKKRQVTGSLQFVNATTATFATTLCYAHSPPPGISYEAGTASDEY